MTKWKRQRVNYRKKFEDKAEEAEFKVGDKVMIRKMSRTKGLSPKLSVKYQGPFILKDLQYCLELQMNKVKFTHHRYM